MQKVIRTHLLPYGIALLSVAAVLLLTFLIEPLRTKTNYMLFFGAVMVSAWYGGLWPGLLAVLLSLRSLRVGDPSASQSDKRSGKTHP